MKLSEILEILEYLKTLEDNWDSYGAVPPSEEVLKNSLDFIMKIPNEYLYHLKRYSIQPSNNGTIYIEWENGDKFIEYEIGDKEFNDFSYLDMESSHQEPDNYIKIEDLDQNLESIISKIKEIYMSTTTT